MIEPGDGSACFELPCLGYNFQIVIDLLGDASFHGVTIIRLPGVGLVTSVRDKPFPIVLIYEIFPPPFAIIPLIFRFYFVDFKHNLGRWWLWWSIIEVTFFS
jgi:hypothetical protein